MYLGSEVIRPQCANLFLTLDLTNTKAIPLYHLLNNPKILFWLPKVGQGCPFQSLDQKPSKQTKKTQTCLQKRSERVQCCLQWSKARAKRLRCHCRWAIHCEGSESRTREDLQGNGSGARAISSGGEISFMWCSMKIFAIFCYQRVNTGFVIFYLLKRYWFMFTFLQFLRGKDRQEVPETPHNMSSLVRPRAKISDNNNKRSNWQIASGAPFHDFDRISPEMIPVAVLHCLQYGWHCKICHLLCRWAWWWL